MFFIRLKRIKSTESIKRIKRQNVKQANKNKRQHFYVHKTSKRKKIVCLTFYTFCAFYSCYAFCALYAFYVFCAREITLITLFTILLKLS